MLASGKASAVTAATIMGIAQRNLRNLERQRRTSVDSSASAVAAHDEFADWLADTVGTEPIESEEALEASVAAIRAVVPDLLLPRANAEADSYGPPSSHRVAILAWFSKRPEVEAGDVLQWAQQQVLEVIETHGSLVAWHTWQKAEDEAEHARREAEYAEIRAKAEALKAESRQASFDNETKALLAAAEAYLRSGTDD
ncbi:MAG TPA: hypothetical protein VFP66_02205 [Candidatus Limnocylindrales bacterium]|nr:hypothetical protein [Candidatus Limnocylindrales bacterium]